MKSMWAGIAVAAMAAIATSADGCSCLKFFGPRMDAPTIGTRSSAMSSLSIKSSVDSAKYLGCDIKYWNMPAGSHIELAWHVYADEDGDGDVEDDPINKTKPKQQDVSGSGTINAYLQSLDGEFHPGIYECKWKAVANKTVEGGEASAKITVGDVKKAGASDKGGGGKKKKKGGDDDDGDKKKKKKDKGDDD